MRADAREGSISTSKVPALHAIAHTNEHAPNFTGRARCKPRVLQRAHITEKRPLRLDAPGAHLPTQTRAGGGPFGPLLAGASPSQPRAISDSPNSSHARAGKRAKSSEKSSA